ncbi:hypothetical protein FA95DRAFT_1451001, partial [Auriscalpium vulgare]
MWQKISSSLRRQAAEDSETQADVMSSVLERHPNLSVFHGDDEDDKQPEDAPFPTSSPPSSPSKHGRRGMFKRMSRKADSSETPILPGSLKLHIPKKVKSHLNLVSQASLSSLPDPAARISSDTTRPSMDSAKAPMTPAEGRFGSLRSILRDRNTPATGQSVRFFSRDAYKVTSPEVSAASEHEEPFMDRLQLSDSSAASSRPRPPLTHDLFTPTRSSDSPSTASPMLPTPSFMGPLPPPDISNIFDLSQVDLPAIPTGGVSLLDTAVEEFEGDGSKDSISASLRQFTKPPSPLTEHNDTVFHSAEKPTHDRSQSFSFGQTVFSLMPQPSPQDNARLSAGALAEAYPGRSPSRNRSMSDTMFHTMLRSKSPIEADIHDVSSSSLVPFASPAAEQSQRAEPDPFSANATTYYTPGKIMPPTPPPPTHTRKASREEDLIWSLQTQLTLQQELCAQYEIDLGARDELVSTLSGRLENLEKDAEKRRNVTRGWKKKVQELEKLCRHLEEEVDHSRQESFERSVMDEASGEALRQLHRQIADLEREKGDAVKRAEEEKAERASAVEQLTAELKKRQDGEKALKDGIKKAREEIEQMGRDGLPAVVGHGQASKDEREGHEWAEERAQFIAAAEASAQTTTALQGDLDYARQALVQKEEEMSMLRAELESQWKHTEEAGERLEEMKQERDTLQSELVALEVKVENMELEFNQGENRRVEAEADVQDLVEAKEQLEQEKVQLEEELLAERDHAEEVTRALQEREDRVEALHQELKFAQDNAARLEQNIRQRDLEMEELAHRIVSKEDEVEELREEMSGLKREQSHDADTQRRSIADLTIRAQDAQTLLESAVKQKAESDVEANALRERVRVVEEDIGRLRRQVHELMTESADKDMRLVQMEKQRDAARDDFEGANIALDSKQQELEMIKRKLNVKGTAGATPAASKIVHRRESSIFSTPSAPGSSRPVSRLSDPSRDAAKAATGRETPLTANTRMTMLGKSIRANGPSVTSTPSAATKAAARTGRSVDGAMGPPPSAMKPRASVAGTPTPAAHSRIPSTGLARSLVKSGASTPTT